MELSLIVLKTAISVHYIQIVLTLLANSRTSQVSTNNKQFSLQIVLKMLTVAWFSAYILVDLHFLKGYTERYLLCSP